MSGISWSEIPADIQARIVAGDSAVLNPLAAWLHEHRPRHVSDDVIQKTLGTLCNLMGTQKGRTLLNNTRCIPDFLAALATRHRGLEARAERRLREAVQDISGASSSDRVAEDPSARLAESELRNAIRSGLGVLPPFERDVLTRVLIFRERYSDIAASLLGGPSNRQMEQSLRKLVQRARLKLRRRLSDLSRD